jgi:1,6-anhydro-N-acetylmuramate kinase
VLIALYRYTLSLIDADALRRFDGSAAAICGGGVKNDLLWRLLEQQSEGCHGADDRYGVPADSVNPGFAVLAALVPRRSAGRRRADRLSGSRCSAA